MAWNKAIYTFIRRSYTRIFPWEARSPLERERHVNDPLVLDPYYDDKPGCAYGLVTRKSLEELSRDLARLEDKINGLIFGAIATIILQIWRSLGIFP